MWTSQYVIGDDAGKVRVGPIGEQQVRSLTAFFAVDGIELKVLEVRRGTDMSRVARVELGLEEFADA